ncbi:MAG TPA: OPT family oligopeptide transporter, partial [Planctomycetes bacterium]|nr:OPT family oligopeptide transporter [Planctomycetota bacterium]
MSIFQKAPRTAEEFEACAPLDLAPSAVAEFDEAEWYAKAYRGETPQLTMRAVLMGSVLGFFLAFTNLYIGLKTGWHLGVAITACILSYSIWQGMLRFGIAKTNMTILENNCMQSTASAAGYSTGGTFVSAIAALLMIQGVHLPIWVLVVWTFFLAILGVTLAIPMKRNMINQEKLKFPS